MRISAWCVLAAMILAGGCSDGRTAQTYTVSLKNETKAPLTIGFTKEGFQDQDVFIAPETLALDNIDPATHSWGQLVPPGKTASTDKPMTAHLDDGAAAFVRVYKGHLNLLEILAISPGSPSRLDVPLMPGENTIILVERDGKLAAIKK